LSVAEKSENYVAEEGEVTLLSLTLPRGGGANLRIHKPDGFPLKTYAELIAGVVNRLAGVYGVDEDEFWDAIEDARDNLEVVRSTN
jgi:hypothetical protein